MSRKMLARGMGMLSLAATMGLGGSAAKASLLVFDDFNVNEGHFNTDPLNGAGNPSSGSSSGLKVGTPVASTADRVTTDHVEGAGSQKIVLTPTTVNTSTRLRHLSGGGTISANTAFTTSAATDGWIGVYAKTAQTGITVQFYLEGASNNGSVQKTLISDGNWHLYEWNLDDTSGGANGWDAGGVSGIIAGTTSLSDGSHTFDSIVYRNTSTPSSETFFMDYVVKSSAGSVAPISFSAAATKTDLTSPVTVTGSGGSYTVTSISAPAGSPASGSIRINDIGNEAGTLNILLDLSNTTAALLSDLSTEIMASLPGSTVTLNPGNPDWATQFDGSWSLLITAPNLTTATGNDWLNLELPGGMTINRVAVIPEPTALGLVGAGAVLASGRRRRQVR